MSTNSNPHSAFPQSEIPFRYRCDRCFDTGLGFTSNQIGECPTQLFDPSHPIPNAASEMLRNIVTQRYAAAALSEEYTFRPNKMAFDLARALTHYTSQNPCPTVKLLDYFFSDTHLGLKQQLRVFAYTVEELRNTWTLPVGSRKRSPAGYWIITDLEDCKEWLRQASSAPRTQLVTIWRAARNAFPILAGQREFDFMNGIDSVEGTDAV